MNKDKFIDYSQDIIEKKFIQVKEFEKKYGKSDRTKAWIKWCTDANYREREWHFRKYLASIKINADTWNTSIPFIL